MIVKLYEMFTYVYLFLINVFSCFTCLLLNVFIARALVLEKFGGRDILKPERFPIGGCFYCFITRQLITFHIWVMNTRMPAIYGNKCPDGCNLIGLNNITSCFSRRCLFFSLVRSSIDRHSGDWKSE